MCECYNCGFYDSDFGCTCPSMDMWYAYPIESQLPENQQMLEDFVKFSDEYIDKR